MTRSVPCCSVLFLCTCLNLFETDATCLHAAGCIAFVADSLILHFNEAFLHQEAHLFLEHCTSEHSFSEQFMAFQGSAPEGMEFVDVEEEFQLDEHGNGHWNALPAVENADIIAAAPTRKPKAKARRVGSSKKQATAA